jgi:hypothetical protein
VENDSSLLDEYELVEATVELDLANLVGWYVDKALLAEKANAFMILLTRAEQHGDNGKERRLTERDIGGGSGGNSSVIQALTEAGFSNYECMELAF